MATRKQNNQNPSVSELLEQEEHLRTEQQLPKNATSGKPKNITVNFDVTVPAFTAGLNRSVRIAGTLQKLNGKFKDWDPHGVELSQVDKTHWTVSLTGPENSTIEYKYTLGEWDYVERNENCQDIPNRKLTLKAGSAELETVHDTVKNWRNEGPCK